MRRLVRLLILGGLLAGAWKYLRQLLDETEQRPLASVQETAKSAAGSVKAAGETVKEQVSSAGEAIRDQATSVSTGHGNGAASLSKAELYRQAQELDVEGRSKMTKDELADAVAKAKRGGGS